MIRIKVKDEVIQEIKRLSENGLTVKEVAKLCDVSESFVDKTRAKYKFNIPIAKRRRKWTEDDKQYAIQLLESGTPLDIVVDKTGRTPLGLWRYFTSLKIFFPQTSKFATRYKKEKESFDSLIKRKIANAKNGCKYTKRSFNITFEHVKELLEKQNNKCYYTGIPFEPTLDVDNCLSIDRIDPSKGYEPENIVLCLWIVNRMKTDLNQEEFYKLCKLIASLH